MPPEREGSNRLPPQNLEAERSVLGSMLRDVGCIGDVLQIIREDSFYTDAHRKIFRAIVALYDKREKGKGSGIDLVTIGSYLQDNKLYDDVGGAAYLYELWDCVATAANAEYYARIVRDKALVRNLIHAS